MFFEAGFANKTYFCLNKSVIKFSLFEVLLITLHFSEKYLQEVWPSVKSALKEYGISCELNLVRKNYYYTFFVEVTDFYEHGPDLLVVFAYWV